MIIRVRIFTQDIRLIREEFFATRSLPPCPGHPTSSFSTNGVRFVRFQKYRHQNPTATLTLVPARKLNNVVVQLSVLTAGHLVANVAPG